MSVFVERCVLEVCSLPKIDDSLIERSTLLSKLVQERRRPRLLVAPSGYGKTTVCSQYVKMMFSDSTVFWCDCSSPCFFRDLQNSEMLNHFSNQANGAAICVFDNVPKLVGEDLCEFEQIVETISESSVEILITTAPEANPSFLKQLSLAVLRPEEFVFQDREDAEDKGVPILCHSNNHFEKFFNSIRDYGLRRSELLVYFSILALQVGNVKDIEGLSTAKNVASIFNKFSLFYPHLGIDCKKGAFSSCKIDASLMKQGLNYAMSEIVRSSVLADETEFLFGLAGILVERKQYLRAYELVSAFCKVNDVVRWAINNGITLIDAGQIGLFVKATCITPQQLKELRDEVNTINLVANYATSNQVGTEEFNLKLFRSHNSLPSQRLLASLLSIASCGVEDRYEYAKQALECTGLYEAQILSEDVFSGCRIKGESLLLLNDILLTYVDNRYRGFVVLLDEINVYSSSRLDDSNLCALLICSRLVISDFLFFLNGADDLEVCYKRLFGNVEDLNFVRDLFECLIEFVINEANVAGVEDKFYFELVDAVREVIRYCDHLNDKALKKIDKSAKSIIEEMHSARAKDAIACCSTLALNQKKPSVVKPAESRREKPSYKLRLTFFGCAQIELNGHYFESDILRKKNPCYMLFWLSKNLGRELGRNELVEKIWEDAPSIECKHRNFYSTLSHLKKELNFKSGFDFIKKSSVGYYLDAKHCESDLLEFDSFCNKLCFEPEVLLRDMDKLSADVARFSRPLIPMIRNKINLPELRYAYEQQLIDSLILAAVNFMQKEEYRNALWFAKQAKEIDRNREDAYELIMKAQSALHLRSSAFSTYFECRDALDVSYGIKPSDGLQSIYKSLLT